MDTSSQNKINPEINWHYETLPRRTKKAFVFLSQQEWLKRSKWYLAGGTALALQAGNRKSLDLDFFTEEKNFDEKKLIAQFIPSLINPFPLPLDPFITE
ncbi:MAG: nucleotidyl transferase AbiEii/AbiGii toxin family protein [Candidatus Niyogibacteria bacterium]|nr:nucleotidyl transferase AbiEii/AbiGii toxin family protein [Candidatus Niyogibacteria bacterium]